MQIKLDMKILVFALIFYITHQIKIYALLMIFACLHELAHLITALILGVKPAVIEIKPIGFAAAFKNPIEDYNKKILKANILELKKIFIYMAGPLFNVVLALVINMLNIDFGIKQELVYINLIIAFVNFLPVYPLDGGRIFKCIIALLMGGRKAYVIIEEVSLLVTAIIFACGSIVILKIHNYGLIVMLLYLLYVTITENKNIQRKIKLYNIINERSF